MAKLTSSKEVINVETGEIETTKNYENLKLDSSLKFVFVFTEHIGKMQGLTAKQYEVLFGLVQKINYDNEVSINQSMKKNIMNLMNIASNTFDKAIMTLTKKKIIIRKARGFYVLNPLFFGKGSLHRIKKLRIINEIDFYNRKIKLGTEYEYMTDEEIESLEIRDLEERLENAKEKLAIEKRKKQLEREKSLFKSEKDN